MDINHTICLFINKRDYLAAHVSVLGDVMTNPTLDYPNASHVTWWIGCGVFLISYSTQKKERFTGSEVCESGCTYEIDNEDLI